ncbi:TetR/AcrR family transcriptional regulator [Paenibacillus odorifer]|uniref:HTH tetR-type domain-containing protein n=1 Tax=Paenibacillus odorifer TaxID=189426 RepID=A0A1R0Y212_9BACL|nr:TetR/AcrR family transcriptional regulator [Paenibacillus odorifer]OMD41342.1 hypothetical protein BSK52_10590 [Paenibacillus odorifer]
MTTKEKILYEALALFSNRGYGSVSVREIAGAVGIRESALYKHYKNKQDIFDTVVQVAAERIQKLQKNLSESYVGNDVEVNWSVSDQLQEVYSSIFSFYLNDEIMSQFRKMMTIEQYRNPDMSQLFREMFIDKTLRYQSEVFRQMQLDGTLIQSNSDIMALHFYSPIFLLLFRYDGQIEKADEALELVKSHIKVFFQIYSRVREEE